MCSLLIEDFPEKEKIIIVAGSLTKKQKCVLSTRSSWAPYFLPIVQDFVVLFMKKVLVPVIKIGQREWVCV